jgi:DNA-binding transcriptional ArsR family regulator
MEREREQEIARLVDKRFEILNEFNITELVEKTDLDHGNISRYIDELEREKLVTTREGKRGRGKPYRYCRLTDKCRMILGAFVDAAKPEPKELEKPDFEWVELLIRTLEGGTPESQPSEEGSKEALNDFHQDLIYFPSFTFFVPIVFSFFHSHLPIFGTNPVTLTQFRHYFDGLPQVAIRYVICPFDSI